ncbi:MAG: hypothetical protein Q4P31_02340 [Andreesenia angusta]|nr:hypothetical protein [Andreesenia angusta]
MNKNFSINIVRGGIVVALIIISLYLSTVFRFNRLSIMILSSILIAVSLIKLGLKHSIIIYMATSLLSLIIIPEKTIGISFTIFFGSYPIIKALAEKKRKFIYEYILKYIFFNFSIFLFFLSFKYGLLGRVDIDLNIIIILLILELLFLIYDKIFTIILIKLLERFGRFLNE